MIQLVILALCLRGAAAVVNYRPVVGILAQEVEPDDPFRANYTSYLAAAYVKAVEAAGARVVPVFINRELGYYRDLLNQINGVVLTGGSSNLTSTVGFARSAKIVLNIVMEMNKEGDEVPVLGVCMGMEMLVLWSNKGRDLLHACNVENTDLPLKFSQAARNSSLYRYASEEQLYILARLNSTVNHHTWCVTDKNLTKHGLTGMWRVLSHSLAHGEYFVSSLEMRTAPVAGIQFHPEKTSYEWNPSQQNDHTRKAILANRLFYDWLVEKARHSGHSSDDRLQRSLIYNFVPTFTGAKGMYDVQNYYFSDPSLHS